MEYKSTFEENIAIIDKIIFSKKDFWQLKSLSYMDFSDVAQIIRLHIHKKWEQYDHSKPLENWVSKICTHKIINLIRDHYGRLAPPCNKCPFNNGGNDCSLTESGTKSNECLRYKKWSKSKKNAYGLKLAFTLEEVDNPGVSSIDFNIEESAIKFHDQILPLLSEKMKRAYRYLFIENLSDEEAAIKLGFKTSEARTPGYKQLMNIKNKIITIAHKEIQDFDIVY